MNGKYPTTKEMIYLLGMDALLATSILMPGAGYIAKEILRSKEKDDWGKTRREWKKFNPYILKRNLGRLQKQKVVEVLEVGGQEIIKLTKKGHTKYLKFKLEELSLNGSKWDRKWRIVMYDISRFKKPQQSAFRNLIKNMHMLQIQKSVYITPYPCDEQITYLREYFDIGDDVLMFRADKIENEEIYKEYFGI